MSVKLYRGSNEIYQTLFVAHPLRWSFVRMKNFAYSLWINSIWLDDGAVCVWVCVRCVTNCALTHNRTHATPLVRPATFCVFSKKIWYWRRKVNRFNTYRPDYTRKAHKKSVLTRHNPHFTFKSTLWIYYKSLSHGKCRLLLLLLIKSCGKDMAFDKIDRVYVCVCMSVFELFFSHQTVIFVFASVYYES